MEIQLGVTLGEGDTAMDFGHRTTSVTPKLDILTCLFAHTRLLKAYTKLLQAHTRLLETHTKLIEA